MREDVRPIINTVEMPRKAELEIGASEQQMATYERGNSTQEDTVKNASK
jgi:hypothetical protein